MIKNIIKIYISRMITIIIFILDRRHLQNISILLKVIEKFIFNTEKRPECSVDHFNQHGCKSHHFNFFHKYSRIRIVNFDSSNQPVESANEI